MPDDRSALGIAWEKFDRGDHISDDEVKLLIRSAEQGANYLSARGESLAFHKTVTDLEALKGYLRARRAQKRQ